MGNRICHPRKSRKNVVFASSIFCETRKCNSERWRDCAWDFDFYGRDGFDKLAANRNDYSTSCNFNVTDCHINS